MNTEQQSIEKLAEEKFARRLNLEANERYNENAIEEIIAFCNGGMYGYNKGYTAAKDKGVGMNEKIDFAIEQIQDIGNKSADNPTWKELLDKISQLQVLRLRESPSPSSADENNKPLEQEQFNHIMTRTAWDTTIQERDDLKNQVKALSAIKKGLEKSLSEALTKIADDSLAVGFAKWCGENYVHSTTDNTDSWHDRFYKYFSTDQLFSIYKQSPEFKSRPEFK